MSKNKRLCKKFVAWLYFIIDIMFSWQLRSFYIAYQFWFKLIRSHLQILPDLVSICLGAFTYCFHDSFVTKIRLMYDIWEKSQVWCVIYLSWVFQTVIWRSGNVYFRKTEAHTSRIKKYFSLIFHRYFQDCFLLLTRCTNLRNVKS